MNIFLFSRPLGNVSIHVVQTIPVCTGEDAKPLAWETTKDFSATVQTATAEIIVKLCPELVRRTSHRPTKHAMRVFTSFTVQTMVLSLRSATLTTNLPWLWWCHSPEQSIQFSPLISLEENFQRNENAQNWEDYRLALARMQSIRDHGSITLDLQLLLSEPMG